MKIRRILLIIISILPYILLSSSDFINLSGLLLTHQDLVSFKDFTNSEVSHSSLIEKMKKENFFLYKYVQSNCMWHLQTPMTGMSADKKSSYIPYRFDLWQLAPKKGKGVLVALLDTGVAAFEGTNIIKHPDLALIGFNRVQNYNCCFKGLSEFIKHSSSFLKPNHIPMESEFITAIIDYCVSQNPDTWCLFLKKYGRADFFDLQGNLTQEGNDAIVQLTTGRKGIMPYNKLRFFSPIMLRYPFNYATLSELLPVPSGSLVDKNNYYLTSHGTHIYGIINSQGGLVCGLAPNASTIMLKVSDGNGISDAQTILDALKKAHDLNADVINISLKIEQTMHNGLCRKIEQELQKFKYVVAASGNEFLSNQKPKVSFPACLTCVAFTVGAYYYDGRNYCICPFSQYEKNNGPTFVAPGLNILSTAIPRYDGEYLFLSGTSMATALVSGFVALMLAEFKDVFNKDQLLKVCYYFSRKLDKSADWNEKCLYGALDMRAILFTLHVCKRLKEKKFFDERKFERYINATSYRLERISNHFTEYRLPDDLLGTLDFIAKYIIKEEKGKEASRVID